MKRHAIRIARPVLALCLLTSVAQGQESTRAAPDDSATTSSAAAAVKGRGTPNFIPLWIGARTLGNSILFQAGNSVGVGTRTPQATLDVTGNASIALQGSTSDLGVHATGVAGWTASTSGIGVYGAAAAGAGNAYGVVGDTNTTGFGAGVAGSANATSGTAFGVFGQTASPSGNAVFGHASATSGSPVAVVGFIESPDGVAGQFVAHAGSGLVLQGLSGGDRTEVFSVDASGNVVVAGNLAVNGMLSKGGGSFKIDHPLDPANRTLSHSFVESSDMMNIYNGIARLDVGGRAWVTLPDWCESLNGDFRYLLTAIGAPQPGLYIAEEVRANRFEIAGGKPGAKVSWQLTGIRHDAYASAHRLAVEEDKPAAERGYYLHPEVIGQPPMKGVSHALQR